MNKPQTRGLLKFAMGKVIELKITGQRAQLREAQQKHQLIRLWRGDLEHGSFCGYVGGVGREFFLLWVVGDAITYDGMYVMRHRDITELEAPDTHHVFMEKALALKGILPRPPRGFPLDNIREVVQAAGQQASGHRHSRRQRGRGRGLLHRPADQRGGGRLQHAGDHPRRGVAARGVVLLLGRSLHHQHRGRLRDSRCWPSPARRRRWSRAIPAWDARSSRSA